MKGQQLHVQGSIARKGGSLARKATGKGHTFGKHMHSIFASTPSSTPSSTLFSTGIMTCRRPAEHHTFHTHLYRLCRGWVTALTCP